MGDLDVVGSGFDETAGCGISRLELDVDHLASIVAGADRLAPQTALSSSAALNSSSFFVAACLSLQCYFTLMSST